MNYVQAIQGKGRLIKSSFYAISVQWQRPWSSIKTAPVYFLSDCINITFYTLKDMLYMDGVQDALFGREGA